MPEALSKFAALLAGTVILGAGLANDACAALIPERQKLFTAGRYAELEVLMEKEIGNDPAPKSAKLMFQCAAYSRLKRYNRLFPCLAKLEDNVRKGDTAMNDIKEMERDSPFLAGLARMGAGIAAGTNADKLLAGTVEPFLHLMYAEAWNELRDYDKAIVAAKAANAAIPTGISYERAIRITTLTAQGLAEGFAGHVDEARRIAEQLFAIGTSYPYSLLAAEKMLGVARIYVSIGDFRKANEALKVDTSSLIGSLAVGMADSIAGMDIGDSMFSYVELPKEFLLNKTQLEIGEPGPAKAGFDKLLKDKRTASNGEIYWLLLYDRGRIAAAEGDMELAAKLWRQAVDVIEQQRSTINTEANKIGFAGDKQAAYRDLVGALFALQKFDEAFDYVERAKSRALVDLLAGQKEFAVASGNADAIRDLLSRAEGEEIASLAQGAEQRGATRNLTATAIALREQAPELASLVSVGSVSLADIRGRLAEDEALLEYFYDAKWLYTFVLTRTGLQAVRSPIGELEAELRSWRSALENRDGPALHPAGEALHRKLIGPVAAFIEGRRLTLVAHGALHYVPLAALHDGRDYLIDRHAVRVLPSASVMKYLRSGEGPYPGGVLALGNPDLGDAALDLQFAQQEAIEIARMVPASKALLRKEANEGAVRKFGPGFRYLHFATHGTFDSEKPLDSAVLLAKDESGSGQLTVGKLYAMRLDSDLVTLSACETGMGKIANGDDVVGLTRGFLYAGAATVVASLWKVDDLATAELMRNFYANLSRMDKLDALRAAQIETRKKFPSPYFWAPFQLLGNPSGGRYVAAPPPAPVPSVSAPAEPAPAAAPPNPAPAKKSRQRKPAA